jgi:regulator of protease activity HflC (stomatin/prohibitin superfamily)
MSRTKSLPANSKSDYSRDTMPEALIGLPVLVGAYALIYFLARKARLDKTNKQVNVLDFQSALRYKNGQFTGLLGPGKYKVNTASEHLVLVDTRPVPISFDRMQVITRDGEPLQVSVTARVQVIDPVLAIRTSNNYIQDTAVALKDIIRKLVNTRSQSQIAEQRAALEAEVVAQAREKVASSGLRLLALDFIEVSVGQKAATGFTAGT